MLVTKVTWNVVTSPTFYIHKPVPCDLMCEIWGAGDASVDLQLESFKRILCAASYFEMGQKQSPTTKHFLHHPPGIVKLQN